MVDLWDRAAVLALAPDASSAAAADRLAAHGAWLEHGYDDAALWGSCQGNGRTPYQTTIAPGSLAAEGSASAFGCSCPSRKAPCKHVLALLLLWADGAVSRIEEPPTFARTWLERRTAAPARGGRREPGVLADPEAAAKRAAARVQRVRAGLDDLDLWLMDQVRGGIATLERSGYGYVDGVAARMVDAQAPGVASSLRSIAGQLSGPDWPTRVLAQLAGLRLLIQAHRRLDSLPEDLAATVRSRIGYPMGRETVLATPGVADLWQAVTQIDSVDYQLETRRVWLYGRDSRRWAVWMVFAPPGAALDASIRPGFSYRGTLHFYPGSGHYRALPGTEFVPQQGLATVRPESLAEVGVRFAELIGADPWADRMPVIISGSVVAPSPEHDDWRLIDVEGRFCRLDPATDPWELVAASIDGPAAIVGEWRPTGLRALGLVHVAQGQHDQLDQGKHDQLDQGKHDQLDQGLHDRLDQGQHDQHGRTVASA